MNTDTELGAEILVRGNRIFRRHMEGFHKPARLVTTDRKEGKLGPPKTLAHLLKMRAVASVAGKINSASWCLDQESAPKRRILIEETPPRKMAARREGHADVACHA